MKNPPFVIGDAVRFGWRKTRAHSGVLFQGMLTLFALQVASSIVDRVLHGTVEGFLALLALSVVNIFVSAGFMLVTLKLAKGEHASYTDLLPSGTVTWHYFCATVFSGLLIMLGLILLIIPGVYLFLRFSMVRFAVLDGEGIKESLTRSAELTKGVKWRLLAFLLALLGLNVLGALALLMGLLITVPVSAIAYAHVYLALKHRS